MMLININKEFNLWYYYSNFSLRFMFDNRRDRSKLSYGVSCQKVYNSINICQKKFFLCRLTDVILIYGVKWFTPKASCIFLTTTFKKMKLANKFFWYSILSCLLVFGIANRNFRCNHRKWHVLNKFWLWLNNHYCNKICEYKISC